jgi:hypothetical protein
MSNKKKSWLRSQDNYRTIPPFFRKLAQYYNCIPHCLKVVASERKVIKKAGLEKEYSGVTSAFQG